MVELVFCRTMKGARARLYRAKGIPSKTRITASCVQLESFA
jgi:hypothetical protein